MLIMNFHQVEPLPEETGIDKAVFESRKGITVTPEGLKNIIKTLRMWGIKIVSLQDVINAGGPHKLSGRTALLTFDDGYVNNFVYGLPVLEEMECPATIFLLAGKPSGSNDWDQLDVPEYNRDKLLSEDQIREFGKSRWISFGSHGLYHKPLDTLEGQELQDEILKSYDMLSEKYPEAFLPVMAYPWGRHNQAVVDVMNKSPYKLGFTVEKAPWTAANNPYRIPRYTAYFSDGSPVKFTLKLAKQWAKSQPPKIKAIAQSLLRPGLRPATSAWS